MATHHDHRYTGTAILLHWLMALAIFSLMGLGVFMTGLSLSPLKLQMYAWHKWAGVSVFLLVLVRLAWRTVHRPPPLPASMKPVEKIVAQAGHGLLYVLMLAIPLSGWLMSSAKGFQTVWFGVLPLPDVLDKDKAVGDLLQTIHFILNVGLMMVVGGHIAAALKHHFIQHDDVLLRMLPQSLVRRFSRPHSRVPSSESFPKESRS